MKPNLLSPEARVLLLTIGNDPDLDAIASTIRAPGFDWNRFMWLVQKEKAATAVRDALRGLLENGRSQSVDAMTVAAVHQLGRMAQVTEFRMLHLEQLLAGALDTLARENIEVVLLKG